MPGQMRARTCNDFRLALPRRLATYFQTKTGRVDRAFGDFARIWSGFMTLADNATAWRADRARQHAAGRSRRGHRQDSPDGGSRDDAPPAGAEPGAIAAITFTELAASALTRARPPLRDELLPGGSSAAAPRCPKDLHRSTTRVWLGPRASSMNSTTATIHAFCQNIIYELRGRS